MILRNDYILLGTALIFLILLISSPLLLIILIAIPIVILFLDCDFSLKALELYGTKPGYFITFGKKRLEFSVY